MPIALTDIAMKVLFRWSGRPDASLLAVPDIALPIARERNVSALPGISELLDAALVERAEEHLRLAEAGRAELARAEALVQDLSARMPSAPGGVPGGLREAPGEPIE